MQNMSRGTVQFQLDKLILIVLAGILIILKMDSMWNQSVDLSHHYALAYRIAENWTVAGLNDPTLGEMNFYPSVSHAVAAILGFVFGSTFLGMQLVTLLAVIVLWIAVLYIINTLPPATAFPASVILTILVVINEKYLGFNVHGTEVIDNFFFSQLFGHAVLFITMLYTINLEKIKNGWYAHIFLLVMVLISAGIHLLPALQLLGLLFGLVLVDILYKYRSESLSAKKLVFAAIFLILSLTSVVLHPAFTAMRKISENNGSLETQHITYPYGLVVLCLVSMFFAIALLAYRKTHDSNSGYLALKYFGLYGLSVTSLCFLQIALVKLNFGSDYAVKKYVFGLTSYVLISGSVLFGLVCSTLYKRTRLGANRMHAYIKPAVITLSFFGIAYSILSEEKSLDVSDIVQIERQLVNIADVALPLPDSDKSNVVIDLSGMPAIINYMFSIAILKTDRDKAIPDVLIKNELPDLSKYSYILSNSGNRYIDESCNSYSSGSIAVADSSCIYEAYKKVSACGSTFDFSSQGKIFPSFLRGFSNPEEHGRWTDGKKAQFICILGSSKPKKIFISVIPFLFGELRSQEVILSVNGNEPKRYRLTDPNRVINLEVGLPQDVGGDKYVISVETPDAASPIELGLNSDSRQLGVKVTKIYFQ